ncbi:MAG: FadR family transcriptional regulator [Desulfohalobiaceae bacterium]|nr:FadR family transcriptional regulator [Desulfohalobiaceae bacterium]
MKTKKGQLPVKQIRHCSIPERIVHEIRSLIDSGYLQPGNKLPPEREFAEMLGVSRPSVREALGALSLLGIVEHRRGSGSYLSDKENVWPNDSFSILFYINKNALLEIFEARKSIEGSLAGMAAQRRTKEDLAVMKKALDGMELNLDNRERYNENENFFHQAIIDAARNQVMANIMQKIHFLLKETKESFRKIGRPLEAHRKKDFENHKKIYECIKSSQEIESRQAMVEHLFDFENQLKTQQDTLM